MSEMVERVAKVIEAIASHGRSQLNEDLWHEMARAAITEMLEPTPEMIGAVDFTIGIGDEDSDEDLADAWRLMVKKALE